MSALPFPTESLSASPTANRRRLTLAIFTNRDKDKQCDGDCERVGDLKKKSQVPSGGRGGLGNIRASRARTTSAPSIDPELAKLLNPANFTLPDYPSREPDPVYANRSSTSTGSISTTATASSSAATLSTVTGVVRPPLSICTTVNSSSIPSSSSWLHASSRPTLASQSSSSFATTRPSSFNSADFSCDHIETVATSNASFSADIATNSTSGFHQSFECSPPPSPVATTPRASTFQLSLQRIASSMSKASSDTNSSGGHSARTSNSSSSASTFMRTTNSSDLKKHVKSQASGAEPSTASLYATHLRQDARARRTMHDTGASRLGRVEEEGFGSSEFEDIDGNSGRAKGKKAKGKKGADATEEGQFVVRVRTGRGGAGVVYRRDGAYAVDATLYPTTAALTRLAAERSAAQEREIVGASRERAKAVVRTGRGGAASISMAKAKGMAKSANRAKAAAKKKEAIQTGAGLQEGTSTKKRKGLSLWRRVTSSSASNRTVHDGELSPIEVEEHVYTYQDNQEDSDFLVIGTPSTDGRLCSTGSTEAEGCEGVGMAGIGAHRMTSALRVDIPTNAAVPASRAQSVRSDDAPGFKRSGSIYTHRTQSSFASEIYVDLSYAGDSTYVEDDFPITAIEVSSEEEEEEEEEEEDSDIDPDLPSPPPDQFDEHLHRCSRVDAGGGGSYVLPSVSDIASFGPRERYEGATRALASLALGERPEGVRGVEQKVGVRPGMRCAPSRPPPPPPTTTLPPVPVGR